MKHWEGESQPRIMSSTRDGLAKLIKDLHPFSRLHRNSSDGTTVARDNEKKRRREEKRGCGIGCCVKYDTMHVYVGMYGSSIMDSRPSPLRRGKIAEGRESVEKRRSQRSSAGSTAASVASHHSEPFKPGLGPHAACIWIAHPIRSLALGIEGPQQTDRVIGSGRSSAIVPGHVH